MRKHNMTQHDNILTSQQSQFYIVTADNQRIGPFSSQQLADVHLLKENISGRVVIGTETNELLLG